jgi:hypothetical protein
MAGTASVAGTALRRGETRFVVAASRARFFASFFAAFSSGISVYLFASG